MKIRGDFCSRRSSTLVVCGFLMYMLLLSASPDTRAQTPPVRRPESRGEGGAALFSIEGSVVAPDTRTPVGQARVVLVAMKGEYLGTIVTDDEGTFAFYDLPVGVYTLNVTHAQYAEVNERVEITVSSARGLRVALRSRNEAPGAPTGQILPVWAQQIPADARKEYDAGVKELQASNWKKSTEHFAAAIRIYPQYASAYGALGTVHLRLNERKEATAAFESALKIDDNLTEANFGLGAIYSADKRFPEAEKHLLRALFVKPDEWSVLFELGQLYYRMGNLPGAEGNLARAKALHPKLPRIHLLLINVLSEQDKLPESLEVMEDFLRRFPQDSFAAQVRQKRDQLKAHLATQPAAKPKP